MEKTNLTEEKVRSMLDKALEGARHCGMSIEVVAVDLPDEPNRDLVVTVVGCVSLITLKEIGDAFGDGNPVVSVSTEDKGFIDICITPYIH